MIFKRLNQLARRIARNIGDALTATLLERQAKMAKDLSQLQPALDNVLVKVNAAFNQQKAQITNQAIAISALQKENADLKAAADVTTEIDELNNLGAQADAILSDLQPPAAPPAVAPPDDGKAPF